MVHVYASSESLGISFKVSLVTIKNTLFIKLNQESSCIFHEDFCEKKIVLLILIFKKKRSKKIDER